MEWGKIEHKDPQSGQGSTFRGRLSVDVYGNQMLVLKNDKKTDETCYIVAIDVFFSFILRLILSLDTLDSWSMIDVKSDGLTKMVGNSVIYKNILSACFAREPLFEYLWSQRN